MDFPKMNGYELAGHGSTTGWNSKTNEVNGENFYKMKPIEVAAQAGDAVEFRAIMLDIAFEPTGARVHHFAHIGRLTGGIYAEERYARLLPELALYEQRFAQVA
jgi:hypothetical protein